MKMLEMEAPECCLSGIYGEKLNYEIQKMLDLRKSAQTTNSGYN